MSHTRVRILAWGITAISALGGLLLFLDWVAHLNGPPDLAGAVHVFGLFLPLLISVLGALIVTRQHGNRVGWLMMIVAFGNVFDAASLVLQPYASAPQAVTPALWLASMVGRIGWMYPLFSFFLIPLYFPTGRPPAGRWNWIMKWAIGMWLTGTLIGGVFSPDVGPGDGRWAMPNPIGLPFLGSVEDPFFNMWPIGIMVIVVGSAASLFVRYRRAGPETRQQIKWLLVAVGLTVAFFVPFFFLTSGGDHSAWLDLGFDLVVLANPLAIAIAIFRYRLWDLDVVVNRALVYGPLTTFLAGIFAMLISVTSVLAKEIFGAQSQAMGAAISAVVVAVIFHPMRDWVQAFVDKHFYPQKRNLDTGLVEVQPEYWAFINQQKLLQIAQAHVCRTLGVTYTAFYLATDGSDFELALPGGGGDEEPARVGPTEKQASELRRKWVVASEGGGPAAGFAPVHIDRGEEIEMLGLLAVGARSNGRGYSDDDLKALADLGGKIGLALNAIQLGEETVKDLPKALAGSTAALPAVGAVE